MASAEAGCEACRPISTRGRRAALISRAARCSSELAAGPQGALRPQRVEISPGKSARPTSLGRPRNTAPGRPLSAARTALPNTSGRAWMVRADWAYLVTGFITSTPSRAWWVRLIRSSKGTSPPIANTGSPSEVAVTRPVTRLVTPGPEVTTHTPTLPVSRPKAWAMKTAFCSWRQSTSSIGESSRAMNRLSTFAPGMPNTWVTPWFSSILTSAWAPFILQSPEMTTEPGLIAAA